MGKARRDVYSGAKGDKGDKVGGEMANGKRLLEDWLSSYADYTADQESPSLFHFWGGVSVISSTLGRSVWLNRGYYTLYPNFYIVFVAASAQVKKTTAINMAYDIFTEACPKASLVSQKGTPESMISLFVESFKERGVSEGIIVSDEFEVFLGGKIKAIDMMQLLTKWYDCPKKFEYHTLSRGKELMNNVCCNLIAGTTPQGLREGLPTHALGGGFASRIIFVYQDKIEKPVPFPFVSEENRKIREKLVHDLKLMKLLKGGVELTKDAIAWFEDWYVDIFRPDRASSTVMDGYFGRKPDTLLKLATVLSVSRTSTLIVDEIELRMALKALSKNEIALPNVLRLVSMTDCGEETEKVLRMLGKKEMVDFTTLSRSFSYCMTTKRLEEVLSDLASAERVVSFVESGKRWFKKKI